MSVAPISSAEQPAAPVPARVPIGWEALFALVVAVLVTGLGAPFGLLWSKVAPHVELVQTQYGPYPIDGEPEGYFADDGWFILMSIGMGVLLAVAAWLLLRRYRGPLVLAGLVVGSVAASVLGAWLGNKIGWAHYVDQVNHAPVDTHIFRPVKLRTGTSSLVLGFIPWVRGTMLVQALAAGAVYTGLAGFHVSPTLRYDNMPPEYLSPAAPQGPQLPGAYPPPPGTYAYPAPNHDGSFAPMPAPTPDEAAAWSNPGTNVIVPGAPPSAGPSDSGSNGGRPEAAAETGSSDPESPAPESPAESSPPESSASEPPRA